MLFVSELLDMQRTDSFTQSNQRDTFNKYYTINTCTNICKPLLTYVSLGNKKLKKLVLFHLAGRESSKEKYEASWCSIY